MAQSGRRVIWHCLPLACQKDSRRNSLRSCTPFPRGGPPPAADLFTKSATRRERGDVRRVALECGWVSCEGKPAGAGAPRAEICGLPPVPRARACRPSSEAERGSYDTSIDQESHCGRPHPMCGMPPASPVLGLRGPGPLRRVLSVERLAHRGLLRPARRHPDGTPEGSRPPVLGTV